MAEYKDSEVQIKSGYDKEGNYRNDRWDNTSANPDTGKRDHDFTKASPTGEYKEVSVGADQERVPGVQSDRETKDSMVREAESQEAGDQD